MATKDIFLSYGRESEVTQFVTQLKCDLEGNGFGVWLDTDDIPAGADWHGAIGRGLHQCRALIAVITKKYINSRYCASELYTADGDGKLIFPVIYEDDVDYGASDRGMGVKYVINGINWSMFRPQRDDYIAFLTKLIQGLREKGLGSVLTKGSDVHLHEQLFQKPKSPYHLILSAPVPPSSQATPCSPVTMGASFPVPCPPSPPPKYSDVFLAVPGMIPASGLAATCTVQEDMSSAKVVEFAPTLVAGPCLETATPTTTPTTALTTPTPTGDSYPAVRRTSACTGVTDSHSKAEGNSCTSASTVAMDTIKVSSEMGGVSSEVPSPEMGGVLIAPANGTIDAGAVDQPSVLAIPLTLLGAVATTSVHGIEQSSSSADLIKAADPVSRWDVTDLIAGAASAGPIAMTMLPGESKPTATLASRTPDASNLSPPGASDLHLPDVGSLDISANDPPATSNRSSSGASRGNSPDSLTRSPPHTLAVATTSHPHHHLALIARPIKRIRKARMHLKAKLHNHFHHTAKGTAMQDGEEAEEGEEEEDEEDEEPSITCSNTETSTGPSQTHSALEGADSVTSLSSNNSLSVPLPPMHMKGLRMRLANRLLKGALVPPP